MMSTKHLEDRVGVERFPPHFPMNFKNFPTGKLHFSQTSTSPSAVWKLDFSFKSSGTF